MVWKTVCTIEGFFEQFICTGCEHCGTQANEKKRKLRVFKTKKKSEVRIKDAGRIKYYYIPNCV